LNSIQKNGINKEEEDERCFSDSLLPEGIIKDVNPYDSPISFHNNAEME
jgi:hypothetical protein